LKKLFYRICSMFICFTLTFAQVSVSAAPNSDESINEILSKIVEKFEDRSYEYNDSCHISVVKSGGVPKVWYSYDEQGQLIRENNKVLNKTITYSYDCRGNIKNKKIYPFTDCVLENQVPENTIEYKYADLDRMIDYNGQKITYDEFGNSLQYKNGWKFEWKNERTLSTAVKSGNSIQYEYGNGDYRNRKTVNGKKTEFEYIGDRIVSQKSADCTINWYLPESEEFANFNYNGTDYIYIRNIAGDVIGIADFSGTIVANYTYDSWGKLISITDENGKDVTYDTSHIGYINPIRYRSYYYDCETHLYYLLSRYYDPEVGRFISEDNKEFIKNIGIDLEEYNLYSYCYNNPVNMVDENGHFGTPIQWICAVIGGVAGWYFGDYVARKFGFVPHGKGWKNSTNYWLIRSGVVVGGAAVGWLSGLALMKVASSFLLANPAVMAKMPSIILWILGLGSGSSDIANALRNIIPNTINHIMQSKHAWKLIGNNTWNSASKAIEHVLKHGSAANHVAGNRIHTATYNGQTVQVVTRIINGTLRIVDAWVKTR